MRHLVPVAALLCGVCCHGLGLPMLGQLQGPPHIAPQNPDTTQSTKNARGQTPGQAVTPYDPLKSGGFRISPLTQPTFTPGILLLLELETKFATSVATGGGKAFSSWFAEDAVSLANGKPVIMGRTAIAAQAQWDPKDYQLSWVAQGAQMGPSNDMGFTWGHYEGTFKDQNGQQVKTTGRYMTIWKKASDSTGPGGGWKVALESSADEPEDGGSCCTLPKP